MENQEKENRGEQNQQTGSDWNKGENSKSHDSSGAAKQSPGEGETPASDVYKNETGDPGRTPGSAEGVENFQKTGNE